MAQLCRSQSGRLAPLKLLLLTLSLVIFSGFFVKAQNLYERPVLIVDPGMHTAILRAASADAAGQFIATGSSDKTVRIWSASDGKLLQTIRMPAGPGHVGEVYAVAMSPDGKIIAAAGYGEGQGLFSVYLFDRDTGKMIKRIAGLPNEITELAFSRDGHYLAAGCYSEGLRIFAPIKNWAEAFRDADYGGPIFGLTFADDGRLATSSFDGKVRLYDPTFKLIATQQMLSGGHPGRAAFSPDSRMLAIGRFDGPSVGLLDGHSLAWQPAPNVGGLDGETLSRVAWSADGQTLFAAGEDSQDSAGVQRVLAWDDAGNGPRRAIVARCAKGGDSTGALVPLPESRLFVAKNNPCFMMLKTDGAIIWAHPAPGADFRGQKQVFSVSSDGLVVDFSFDPDGQSLLRFDLRALKLSSRGTADGRTRPAKRDGLRIEDWYRSAHPTLNGKPIKLDVEEWSLSFAVHPDGRRFVLGADWSLRAFDAQGKELWRSAPSGAVWAVNITGDGRLVVAASGDGTIRWYRMDDGRELLALQVLSDQKNWVAWTPEGFYDATPGAFGVLNWHVNHGDNAAGSRLPVSAIPRLKRPDALPLVLQELETARALGIADVAAARSDVRVATGTAVGPGARLHVLAIGVSDYGESAKSLHLRFAAKDAQDVADALFATQGIQFNDGGGLYAQVLPQYLPDKQADRRGILRALEVMKENMSKDPADEDLAVIFFSGHGALINNRFYLLPYGVDANGRPADLEAGAIPAEEFRDKVMDLARYGRVLVLLDACHSGAATSDGSTLASNDADLLRQTILAGNVTVLTSSSKKEFSDEDPTLNNGVFTKVLLEALGKDADEDHDGLISTSELTGYVWKHVVSLSHGRQHPGIQQEFGEELFIDGQ